MKHYDYWDKLQLSWLWRKLLSNLNIEICTGKHPFSSYRSQNSRVHSIGKAYASKNIWIINIGDSLQVLTG